MMAFTTSEGLCLAGVFDFSAPMFECDGDGFAFCFAFAFAFFLPFFDDASEVVFSSLVFNGFSTNTGSEDSK